MSPFGEGEKLTAQGNVIIFSVVVRVIYSRSSSHKHTFWSQNTFSFQIPFAHYAGIFQFLHFPLHAPFLPFHFKSTSYWALAAFLTSTPSFNFHGLFLVDVFTITHIWSALWQPLAQHYSAALSPQSCLLCPMPTQFLSGYVVPSLRWAPNAATVLPFPRGFWSSLGTSPQATPFCFLSCWPPTAPVLQAGLSQCLHHGSITRWSCLARLLCESAQDF